MAARWTPTLPLLDPSSVAPTSLRLFVAVDLDEQVLARVGRVIAEQTVVMPHARWLAARQLHVTLSFLGQVEQESFSDVGARVLDIAGRFPAFNIKIGAAGGFPDARRPSVVWLGVEPDAPSLHGLAAALESAWQDLGRGVEARAYHPHLTLARSQGRSGDARLARVIDTLAGLELGSCAVREIVLYRSDSSRQGVQYTAVLRAPLGGKKQQQR